MCADPSSSTTTTTATITDTTMAPTTPTKESSSSTTTSITSPREAVGQALLVKGEDGYIPKPSISQKTIFIVGISLFLIAKIWPPLLLIVTYLLSIFLPYTYRTNDEASQRRQLIHEFEQQDTLAPMIRQLPSTVQLEESYWTTERGVLLHTGIMTPTDPDVPITAIACYCHGYADNVFYSKQKELSRLVEKGIAVVMIAYEGHGKSDGTLGLVKDWNVMVNDVCTYFQHVSETKFPNKKIFLIGESMGGAVAYCSYRQMGPQWVSGVVFICPMCKLADEMLPPQWVVNLAMMIAGPTGTAERLGYFPISPAKGDLKLYSFRLPGKRAIFTRIPSVFGRNARLATAREIMNVTKDISSSLSEFDAPFLVQHGKADKVTDPKLSQALYDESKSKDKTIKLYDGMWHSLLNGEPTENIDLVMNDTISWILERAEK